MPNNRGRDTGAESLTAGQGAKHPRSPPCRALACVRDQGQETVGTVVDVGLLFKNIAPHFFLLCSDVGCALTLRAGGRANAANLS